MLGDSTVMQVCRTLVNLLVHEHQNCTVQISCGRQDYLVGHKNDNHEFIELIDTQNPQDFVIFSAAAHYTMHSSLDDFNASIHDVFSKIESYRRALEMKRHSLVGGNTFTISSSSYVTPKFIWMQPTPGHLNCELGMKPLSSLSGFNAQGEDPYKWRLLDVFNNFVVDNLLAKYNVSYLDTSILKYRPDGHFKVPWEFVIAFYIIGVLIICDDVCAGRCKCDQGLLALLRPRAVRRNWAHFAA